MNYLYIKVLKNMKNAVLCVGQGSRQKTFYDPINGKPYGFSSGQQTKRSFMERLMYAINEEFSPATFTLKSKGGKLSQDILKVSCNPKYVDQLLGGYMVAEGGKDEKGEANSIKRRSPFSISTLRPVHPLLANTYKEVLVADRRERNNNKVAIKGSDGKLLSDEETRDMLLKNDKNPPALQFTDKKNNVRLNGLYECLFAINLDRLFKVNISPTQKEVNSTLMEELEESGWSVVEDKLGTHLEAPAEYKEKVIDAIGDAILNFRVTSNQSTNFTNMPTVAASVTNDASLLDLGIRGKFTDAECKKARLVIDTSIEGVKTFVSPLASQFTFIEEEDSNAMSLAIDTITNEIKTYCA